MADAAGDEVRGLAERLVGSLDSAVRLVLLEVLADAADVITRDLAPGSVHLRLRGRDADFVVTAPPVESAAERAGTTSTQLGSDLGDGPVSRINFRPPENLKLQIELAAGREGLSVNAWLVRAAAAALDPGPGAGRSGSTGSHFTGWVG